MKPMQPMKPMEPLQPMEPINNGPKDRWWPGSLGISPNSAGGQNDMRYAYFADKNRLAVDLGDGRISVYDTADHRISGVRQAQGGGKEVVFTSERGELDLGTLKRMDE